MLVTGHWAIGYFISLKDFHIMIFFMFPFSVHGNTSMSAPNRHQGFSITKFFYDRLDYFAFCFMVCVRCNDLIWTLISSVA